MPHWLWSYLFSRRWKVELPRRLQLL
ncbi:hypothetical protein Avbf_18218 [Armadillidium vulgare]|nr:hypothetical protein Avbf_18218 [Armadillidium vulgare]